MAGTTGQELLASQDTHGWASPDMGPTRNAEVTRIKPVQNRHWQQQPTLNPAPEPLNLPLSLTYDCACAVYKLSTSRQTIATFPESLRSPLRI